MKTLYESILDDDIVGKVNDKIEAKLKDTQNMHKIAVDIRKWVWDNLECPFFEMVAKPIRVVTNEDIPPRPIDATQYIAVVRNMTWGRFKPIFGELQKEFLKLGDNLGCEVECHNHRNTIELVYKAEDSEIHRLVNIFKGFDFVTNKRCVKIVVTEYNI